MRNATRMKSSGRTRLTSGGQIARLSLAIAVAAAMACGSISAHAAGIFGTMSNFDVFYSESPTINAYGAEIELE
jgi:hypothetical protein